MQNLYKTFYFDLSLFRAMPFFDWLRFSFSKYNCLFFLLLNRKNYTLKLGTQKVEIFSISDLGTVVSSLSDEYYNLHLVIPFDLSVIIDIGANIGQFSNAISYWYPKAQIHAFEAHPITYGLLQKNTQSLKQIVTYNRALSDSKNRCKFYTTDLSVTSSLISTSEDQRYIEIETQTADFELENIGAIDLVKIDVEGAELQVLRGAHKVLQRSSYLLIELSFNRETHNSTNLDVLEEVKRISPRAQIIHTGRKLGWGSKITAQDFLIKLNN